MNVLITGGAGFIGSAIVDLFQKEGHNVYVMDTLRTGDRHNISVPDTHFFPVDILSNEAEEVFKQISFDAVVHQAAQTSVGYSMDHPAVDTRLNVLGTQKMLQLAASYSVKKFVYASTAAVYGIPSEEEVNELSKTEPISPYGLSKKMGEEYCRLYSTLYPEMSISVLRYSNVFGPRQKSTGEAGVVTVFLEAIRKNEPITIYGDGGQTRDFVYVEDVAYANLLALKDPTPFSLYQVGFGKSISILELVQAMEDVFSVPLKVITTDAKPGDIYTSKVDVSGFVGRYGWKPNVTIHEGLQRLKESWGD